MLSKKSLNVLLLLLEDVVAPTLGRETLSLCVLDMRLICKVFFSLSSTVWMKLLGTRLESDTNVNVM